LSRSTKRIEPGDRFEVVRLLFAVRPTQRSAQRLSAASSTRPTSSIAPSPPEKCKGIYNAGRAGKCKVTPPTLNAGRVFETHPKFQVSWSPPPGTQAASFDVRYRVSPYSGGFGPLTDWLTGTTDTSASFFGLPGYTYCFS